MASDLLIEEQQNVRQTRSKRKRKTKEGSGKSSSEEEDSIISSSEVDEDEYEIRRQCVVKELEQLDKQFENLKEQLYRERLKQVELQIVKVKDGTAAEFQLQRDRLEQSWNIRKEIGQITRELQIESVSKNYDCDLQSSLQTLSSEKAALADFLRGDVERSMRSLEAERQRAELSTQYSEYHRPRRFSRPAKRDRSPVVVSGPYLVYMLREREIMEDWAAISRARCTKPTPHRVASYKPTPHRVASYKPTPYRIRAVDGRLYYRGRCFSRGTQVVVEPADSRERMIEGYITLINGNEVWVKRTDGVKCKVYISQLQRGHYVISPVITNSVT